MNALLNIDEYFIEDISVKTNPDYKDDAPADGDVGVTFGIKRQGKAPLFMLTMSVNLVKAKNKKFTTPYQVSFSITGFFSFAAGTDEATINRMIGLNGLAVLYGLARGIVAQVTANGPYGKFILPTVNFVELLKRKAKTGAKKSGNGNRSSQRGGQA